MTSQRDLFDYIVPRDGETFDTLLSHKNIDIVRIVSSDRPDTTLYCQEEDEWAIVLRGEALLRIDGEEKRVRSGEWIFIPAHTRHTVVQTKRGTLWLAIHIR